MSPTWKGSKLDADAFAGDDRVRISRSGRIIPLQCELCVCFHQPKDPLRAWASQLPFAVRSLEGADDFAWRFPHLGSQCAEEIDAGRMPVAAIAVRYLRSLFPESSTDRKRAVPELLALTQQKLEEIKKLMSETEEAARAPDATEPVKRQAERLARVVKGHAAATMDWSLRSEIALVSDYYRLLEVGKALSFAAGSLGECRHDPGLRTTRGFAEGFAELRHGRYDWCAQGELRDDVMPQDPLRNSLSE